MDASCALRSLPEGWFLILTRGNELSRHCEEHERRSNPVFVLLFTGLLRFARNNRHHRQ